MIPANDGSIVDSRAISEKEEIARAALRSLAEHPTGPAVNPPPSSSSQFAVPQHHAVPHAGPSVPPRSYSMTEIHRSTAIAAPSSSFFDNQQLTSSPVSSPRLLPNVAANTQTLPESSGDEFPSSDFHLHESAIRRVSSLLRIAVEDVRNILHQVFSRKAISVPQSALHQASLSGITPDLVQRIVDAYSYQAQGLSKTSLDIPDPRAQSRNLRDFPSRASPSFEGLDSRHRLSAYADANIIPPYRMRPQPALTSAPQSNQYASRDAPITQQNQISAPHYGIPQRPVSPSLFAFDPYRRPSHPVGHSMHPPDPPRGPTRYSLDSGSVRHNHAPTSGTMLDHPHIASRSIHPLYQRKGRSIDDYLEQYPRPGRTSALQASVSGFETNFPADREPRARHDYHPFYHREAQAAPGLSFESQWQSSSVMDAPRSTYIQHRSPRPSIATRSPSMAPSVASAFGFTPSPSPRLDISEGSASSYVRKPFARTREGSEESIEDLARASVAELRIEDKISPAPFASSQIRSVRSSPNIASTPATTQVSHSEVMQRLQQKVKNRLAAKSRGENPDKSKTKGVTSKTSSVGNTRVHRSGAPTKRATHGSTFTKTSQPQTTNAASRNAESNIGAASNKARKLSEANTSVHSVSPVPARTETPNSIAAALLSPTDSPTPTEAARNVAANRASSSADATPTVETASGQTLPGDLPAAGQMNASSAAKQQASMAGIDSLLQAAAATDPTETSSAIA